jgi:hypothetical protein
MIRPHPDVWRSLMSDDGLVCPKCGQQMQVGYLGRMTAWVEGRIPWVWWLNPKNSRPVAAYRCVSCGFLEWYAK